MTLGTILVVVLILALVGAIPTWGYSSAGNTAIPRRFSHAGKHSRATAAGTSWHSISRKTPSSGNWLNTAGKGVNTAGVARHINIRSMTNEIQQSATRPEMGL